MFNEVGYPNIDKDNLEQEGGKFTIDGDKDLEQRKRDLEKEGVQFKEPGKKE
jgi:hypothetical protein